MVFSTDGERTVDRLTDPGAARNNGELSRRSAVGGVLAVVARVNLTFFGIRQRPRSGWVSPVVGGGVSVVLGGLVWFGWPNSEPTTVGTLA
jgi:hypothetical protein